ncbi:ABC transporter permease [Flavobacterium orientale]|uniref:Membrane protein n=1 Tax=Flavobacterium orientale TaxID=1756020 RepID=A0A916XXV5_9FLAO|nr:ABC transporter permease [Flavobacterium orientale]GGD20890.1 membrane protein [Flavobacterium orientale]
MKFPFYIAKRYLFSASKNNAINIITAISSLGIIAGTMAMFVVLSVFSGLKDFSLSFTNDFDPQLKVESNMGKTFFLSEEQEKKLSEIKGVQNYSKIIEEKALFTFNGKDQLAFIKGVDSNFVKVTSIENTIFQGEWLDHDSYQVVIGSGIAQKLSVGLFDFNNVFEAFVVRPGKGAFENPDNAFNKIQLNPIGFYFLNEDLNQKYVFCDLEVAQELLELKSNQITNIEFKLSEKHNESEIRENLKTILGADIVIKNRGQLNESLYRMLNTENLILYLILTLVLIVTLFTLIGALIMMIIDKKTNLKTLFNLGTSIQNLRFIFLTQGFLICIIGGLLGIFLGSIVILLQLKYELFMITPSLAYPVVFSLKNILLTLGTISLLGLLSSWIASSRVNKKLLE